MWLFTKYGFFASANARLGKGEKWQPVDPDRIAIRAREVQHLHNLIKRFPQLNDYPIHEDRAADYPFRVFVPKTLWSNLCAELAEEMDYDRFKPSVIDFPGKAEYTIQLFEVWGVMAEMNDE